MHTLLTRALLLCWGVWFGGLLGVMLAVSTAFQTIERTEAGLVGAAVFPKFERVMLAAGAATLIAMLGLMLRGRSTVRVVALLLVMVASLGVVGSRAVVSPRIDALRAAGQTQTPEFRRMHGASMALYVLVAAALAAAGLLLPGVIAPPAPSLATSDLSSNSPRSRTEPSP